MINKLTRWELIGYGPDGDFGISDDGIWVDFDEVKELFEEQEKKIQILVDGLEEVINMGHASDGEWSCEGYCHVEAAQEALEEYKKEKTMSCFKLNKFVFRCDTCNVEKIIESTMKPDLPKGWAYREVGPCGLTNYYKNVEICPKCVKKENSND